MKRQYYILMIFGDPCPLILEPRTGPEVVRALNWQLIGQGRREEYAITTYNATKKMFVEVGEYNERTREFAAPRAGAREFEVTERCIYTEEAFSRFIDSLPKED